MKEFVIPGAPSGAGRPGALCAPCLLDLPRRTAPRAGITRASASEQSQFTRQTPRGWVPFPRDADASLAGNDNFVGREWQRCRPWIEAALPYCYGTHRIEDVEAQIASGRLQFWPGERCAVVTEIVDYPRLKALNFFLVGGRLSELLEKMEPAIVAWAKQMGCTRVAQTGRKGWGRVLAPLGYQTTLSVMLKEI